MTESVETELALEESSPESLSGAEFADTVYEEELEVAASLGELQRAVREKLIQEVEGDDEAEKRADELLGAVEIVNGGENDNVKLEDHLGDGVLGINKSIGTQNTAMAKDQLRAGNLTDDPLYARDTVLHENDTEVGHASQDPGARTAVIDENGIHKQVVAIEGDVVIGVSNEVGGMRADLPHDTYREGVELVSRIGHERVKPYVKKGGENVGKPLQIESWRKRRTPLEKMLIEGALLGISEEEVLCIARDELRYDVSAANKQVDLAV